MSAGDMVVKEKIRLDCDGHCHILEVEKWDDDWGIFVLTLWQRGEEPNGIWTRIKNAWNVLRGSPWGASEIVLAKEDYGALIQFLSSQINWTQGTSG